MNRNIWGKSRQYVRYVEANHPRSRQLVRSNSMGTYYMRMNKRNLSWKWFLQVRRFIYPWATKSRGRDFFKGGRFVTPWILPFSFSDDFLGFLVLIWFSVAMCFWNLGRSCLPRLYSGLSSSSSSQDHVIFILDLIQYYFSREYSFSVKGITL